MSFLSNLFGNKSAPKPIALSENSREDDSLFLQFENNEARRTYGGSAFIELQCCRLDTDVISDCVNIDNIFNNLNFNFFRINSCIRLF